VAALVRLQLLTGARPGELLNLRPCDIDRTEAVWTVTLEHHKTAHKGHERVLYMGPLAQSILRPFLLRDTDRPLFSPRDAEAQRHKDSRESEDGGRREDQKPNKKKTDRVVRDAYDKRTYHRAIERACAKAGVTRWHPNQLRHNCATALRKTLGIEAAQVMLGHARVDTTEIYAERNHEAARKIAADHG
jgi:integrase